MYIHPVYFNVYLKYSLTNFFILIFCNFI